MTTKIESPKSRALKPPWKMKTDKINILFITILL